MKTLSKVILAVILLIFCSNINGHDLSLLHTQPDSKYSEGIPYLHTDRSYYLAGETIFFKAYIIEESADKSNPVNDTLHVSLLDQEGLKVASGIFPLNNNMITGEIELPDFLNEGNYILIAYTGSTDNLSPEKMFSNIIEIRELTERDLNTDLSLKDTIYEPGSLLTAQIRFSKKDNDPVPASFTYTLNGNSGEILQGKDKANSEGIANLKLQLPKFDKNDNLKLLIIPSYKKNNIITGVVIPTPFNLNGRKVPGIGNLSANEFKHLNLELKTDKEKAGEDEKILLNINVTDEKGLPVMTNLSVSASNIISKHKDFDNGNIVTYAFRKSIPSASYSYEDIIKYFTNYLLQVTQSPGIQYIVQERNNTKKLIRKEKEVNQKKQEGYSPDRSIFDILMSIKPYHMENNKITFGISTMNSLNNIDGALIVVDGIKMGTDASILSTLPVLDIAHISASTNIMDIQKYSGMNNVGVIEVTMKKTSDFVKKEEGVAKIKNNTLFWGPDIITDLSGKASVSFLNNNQSSEVLITVEGRAANGLSGSSTFRYKVN